MLELEVLIGEFLAVNRLAAAAVAVGEVTPLNCSSAMVVLTKSRVRRAVKVNISNNNNNSDLLMNWGMILWNVDPL